MNLKKIYPYSLLLLAFFSSLSAENPAIENSSELTEEIKSLIISEKTVLNAEVIELTLSNGMIICLKPTNYEEDEILVRLSANGGYSLFNEIQRASAELAPQVFLESGFADLTPDKLSVLLYQTSVDFSVNINASNRSLEAICPSDGLETALKLMNLSFTKRKFNETAYSSVIERAKESVRKRNLDFDSTFQEAYMATNTKNFMALRHLSASDIMRADFATSRRFFDYAFSNPDDFVCVIVGDFKEDEIRPLLEKYLGSIPAGEPKNTNLNQVSVSFPKGVISKQIPNQRFGESLVRLTFPIQVEITEKNIFAVELTCQLIEEKLREKIKSQFNTTHGVDVAYEFPLYPSLELSWICIQFRAEPKAIDSINKLVLTELKNLQNIGPSQSDLENAKIQQKQSDEYWLRQNDFWLASLSNYYLVGWDPKHVVQNAKKEKKLSIEIVNEILKNYISLTNYTTIWSTP